MRFTIVSHQENAHNITKILFAEHDGIQDLSQDLLALREEGLMGVVINYFTDAE